MSRLVYTEIWPNTALTTEVDDYAFQHVHKSSPGAQPPVDILDKVYANQVAAGMPNIAVSENQGKFLQVQCRIANAKHVLEFGTLAGYSTLYMVHATPQTKVTTIEVNPDFAQVARANFELAQVADRITILEGRGVDVVAKLLEDFHAGKVEPFDVTFIDADKISNWIYFDHAVQMSRSGAIVIVDNIARGGDSGPIVWPSMQQEPSVIGCREVIEKAGADPRVSASLLQTVGGKNYDGMLICVKL
ncbi:hypothetical protein, variant [Verruconis gallopava]|uniref:O-methyltransferase n=1 Tax=Verruconis gallopava TaxID=253628 RepID=A0A0D1YTE5_9PEZI|nr:uncharacterized protein PV09_04759 [Verruconis gallopava]XP_016213786.1 hypothetical protein, variant [Verruconis gallopava]KIW03916.1 hypothetical protein PV09_04759 [Verruconis gallopava]KIW03917.1 hypothetical protein, variant [Verruconis gallopava]